MKHTAQFALLGVTALAVIIIAIVSTLPEEPIYVYERGHLQAAMLVHLARACLTTESCNSEVLQSLLEQLYSMNESYNLLLFEVTNFSVSTLRFSYGETTYLINVTDFEVRTLTGNTKVKIQVEIRVTKGHTYVKAISGAVCNMVSFSVSYIHRYVSPFFNITLCPLIHPDPEKIADIKPDGPCKWIIGVPERIKLRDEFGIILRIPP
ncbi:MAG: hypothetical protein QXY49_01725 [Thermofilaceae archaeon]